MEQTTERPELVAEDETPGGPFSKGAKKVERIAQESKGLLDDVKEWIDLKIQFTWLDQHAEALQLVVARSEVAERLPGTVPVEPPGLAQRPALDWRPDGVDTVDFLCSL